MTEKQKRFCDEYLIDLNATRAYKAAYPNVKKDDAAAACSSKLLRIAKVQEYISDRQQERQKRTEISQDRVVLEIAAIAFADVTEVAGIRGGVVRLKSTDDLTETQRKAIAGIKETQNGIEIKFNDKLKALELLGRHLGMFRDKVEISGLAEEQSKLSEILEQRRERRHESRTEV